jgi:hypothetical protein
MARRFSVAVAGSALACLNCCTNSLARLIGSNGRSRGGEIGELDGMSVGGVGSYERLNTALLTYTLTGLVDFDWGSGSGIEELRSTLIGLVESEDGFGGEELSSSSGYVQGMLASEENMCFGARLGEDRRRWLGWAGRGEEDGKHSVLLLPGLTHLNHRLEVLQG